VKPRRRRARSELVERHRSVVWLDRSGDATREVAHEVCWAEMPLRQRWSRRRERERLRPLAAAAGAAMAEAARVAGLIDRESPRQGARDAGPARRRRAGGRAMAPPLAPTAATRGGGTASLQGAWTDMARRCVTPATTTRRWQADGAAAGADRGHRRQRHRSVQGAWSEVGG
jgi:hypothetical protein